MQFKTSLVVFFILMSSGAGSYLAVRNGIYPVAAVNFNLITAKSLRANSFAVYRYYQNAFLSSGADPGQLDTIESQKEIRRATLEKLIADSLVLKELQLRLKNEFREIAEDNINKYISNNKNVEQGAKLLYGLNLSDFRSQVLLPQAHREILEGLMFLNNEN